MPPARVLRVPRVGQRVCHVGTLQTGDGVGVGVGDLHVEMRSCCGRQTDGIQPGVMTGNLMKGKRNTQLYSTSLDKLGNKKIQSYTLSHSPFFDFYMTTWNVF